MVDDSKDGRTLGRAVLVVCAHRAVLADDELNGLVEPAVTAVDLRAETVVHL